MIRITTFAIVIVAVSVNLAAALNVAPDVAPVASAGDCSDAEVVFARGTD